MNGSLPKFFVLFLLCGLVAFHMTGCSNSGGGSADATTSTGELSPPPSYVPTGFPQVIVVSGTNYEMGYQYGQQAGQAILHNATIFKSKLYDVYGKDVVDEDMKVWDYYLKLYNQGLRDWIQGISDGCKSKGYNVGYYDVLIAHIFPTELWARPSQPYPAGYHSCNSFAAKGAMTVDGKTVHGIVQMVSTEHMDNVILIAFPNEGSSFACITQAGGICANAGMNSNGIAWSMTALFASEPAWGLVESYFHYLSQFPKTVEEAIEYIKTTPRGGVAGGFLLTDSNGKIVVLESVPDGKLEHYSIRYPGDLGEPGEFVVQTNHYVAPALSAYNPFWVKFIGTYERYDTIFQYLKEATPKSVDFEFVKKMFSSSDWYDSATGTWHYNEPGMNTISNDHSSVRVSLFFPADLTAYFLAGRPSGIGIPAQSTGEYVKLKIGKTPKEVVDQADQDAIDLYWEAADLLESEVNKKPRPQYLTQTLIEAIEAKLDQSIASYSLASEYAAFANMENNPRKRLEMWSTALTHYAKAQLYAQMAKSILLEARE